MTKWRRNGCARPKPKNLLQKALRPEPRNRIYYRLSLPPKYPAGHRKPKGRVTQVHESHKHLPIRLDLFFHLQGRNLHALSAQ